MVTINKKSNAIIAELLKIGSLLHKAGDQIATQYGLNQQQFVVLNKIGIKKELIQKDIISDLLLNKSHVSKILKKLNQQGYVEITESVNDKRKTVIRLTGKGYTVWQSCLDDFNKWNADLLKSMTEEKKDRIYQTVNELTKLLKE